MTGQPYGQVPRVQRALRGRTASWLLIGGAGMAHIELDHVTKRYPGGVPAVNDLTLDIPDGDFVVLVGPSGSGKTTALRMVAGLEHVTSGEIRIGDRVVNDLP